MLEKLEREFNFVEEKLDINEKEVADTISVYFDRCVELPYENWSIEYWYFASLLNDSDVLDLSKKHEHVREMEEKIVNDFDRDCMFYDMFGVKKYLVPTELFSVYSCKDLVKLYSIE